MEIIIVWFWIVRLIVFSTFMYSLFRCYKSKFKSKFWWFMVIVGFVLVFIQPIKITQDNHIIERMNYSIKANKEVLPKKVQNKYFEDAKNKVIGIKEKDLK